MKGLTKEKFISLFDNDEEEINSKPEDNPNYEDDDSDEEELIEEE